jgi:hypothetical protein
MLRAFLFLAGTALAFTDSESAAPTFSGFEFDNGTYSDYYWWNPAVTEDYASGKVTVKSVTLISHYAVFKGSIQEIQVDSTEALVQEASEFEMKVDNSKVPESVSSDLELKTTGKLSFGGRRSLKANCYISYDPQFSNKLRVSCRYSEDRVGSHVSSIDLIFLKKPASP